MVSLHFRFQTKILYPFLPTPLRLHKCNKFKQITLLFQFVLVLITCKERAAVTKLLLKTITVCSNCNAICVISSSIPTRWLHCTGRLTVQLFDRWIRFSNCWFLTLLGILSNWSNFEIKSDRTSNGNILQQGEYSYYWNVCFVSTYVAKSR
jgi:hypothetical protein